MLEASIGISGQSVFLAHGTILINIIPINSNLKAKVHQFKSKFQKDMRDNYKISKGQSYQLLHHIMGTIMWTGNFIFEKLLNSPILCMV